MTELTSVSGIFTNFSFLSTSTVATLASRRASRIPIQLLGPCPNGKNVKESLFCLSSGLNLTNTSYYAFTLCLYQHLTHYQTTNFRLFKSERLCRRQFQIWRKCQKVIQIGRKHCGKRRNCSLRAISPFPTVFSKGLLPRGIKRCHCVGMS